MKIRFLFLLVFISAYCFSQSVNDYEAVIIPVKFDFLRNENQFRLNTLTKFNLKKAGFEVFYNNEPFPKELNDRCSFLYVDVENENTLFMTKLYITFKDCYGALIFQSAVGKSREKDLEKAYNEALNDTFKSVYALQYKYTGIRDNAKNVVQTSPAAVVVPVPVSRANDDKQPIVIDKVSNLFYAQTTPFGFQLVDSEPKVVFKIFRTSNSSCYIALKGSLQGVFISNENQWFFEYYQNDILISERVEVKF